MKTKTITLFSGLILILSALLPVTADSLNRHQIQLDFHNISTNNTVILANEVDAKFSRDFSILLKRLKVNWTILKNEVVPEPIKTKNIIMIGHPDAIYTGKVIRDLIPPDQLSMLQDTIDDKVILQLSSPWMEGRTIIICSGVDQIMRRNAAEDVIKGIIASAPPSTNWIQTTYDMAADGDLREYISQLRTTWEDSELPLTDLTIDLNAKPTRKISAEKAAEDAERLFYLLAHGYSGFEYFNDGDDFSEAKSKILLAIQSQSNWSQNALSTLFYDHLAFIIDRHLTIGEHVYAGHQDFWYDTHLDIQLTDQGYQFMKARSIFTIETINDEDPTTYLYPSLNENGEAIYRIGLLSKTKPLPLMLSARNDQSLFQSEIKLKRSNFDYYTEQVFTQERIADIPVVRVRTFSDYYEAELQEFVTTASSLKVEPVIIVDLRGNGGGNEHWPIRWIQGLTGQRAEAVFVNTELESKTTMVGRANAFKFWIQMGSNSTLNISSERSFYRNAELFENGEHQPRWTAPRFPQIPLIKNNTTVIVVTNNLVASAGEGFIMRLSQAENVLVVGENTLGALTFGNISLHQLPNSKMQVWMPININIFMDQKFREEIGLSPDLWIPAPDAINYTLKALQRGTISTNQPLPSSVLEKRFIPESVFRSLLVMDNRSLLLVAFFTIGGGIWTYFMRKKVMISFIVGVVWIGFSLFGMRSGTSKPLVLGFLLAGIICLIGGLIGLLRSYTSKTAK